MSATNSTPTINLPLFIGTDKPAWLTDWNGSMNTIDSAIATLQTAESGTATALASLSQSVTALSGTVEQHTTAIQTVTTATATNTGSINTITSLIGNGEPTTTDKTIIGAINEIYADIGAGDGVDADEVNYDNTSSGLTASNVQAAIDEVNGKIPSITTPDADDVSYDNTQSGLAATNVQAAIDELASGSAADHVDVTSDGTKNIGQMLNALFAAADVTKVTANARLCVIATNGTSYIAGVVSYNATELVFTRTTITATSGSIEHFGYNVLASGSKATQNNAGTASERTSDSVANGVVYRLVY